MWLRRGTFALVAVLFASPALFVLWRTARSIGEVDDLGDELAGPAGRTLLLGLTVSLTAVVLGTALAWLLVRSNLAARSVWNVVLVLPLVLPSFVGATAFLAGLSNDGLLDATLEAVGLDAPDRFRGFFPAWLLLSLFSYPFVLMPVSARLRSERPSLIESARVLGASPWETARRVTLPHIRSAIAGSGLIVFLYTVSDFGAVQLLGYDTLTRVIYATRQADRPTSFAAATLVLAIALTALVLSTRFAGATHADEVVANREVRRVRLGRWHVAAQLACAVVAAVSLVAPIASLVTWAARGLRDDRVHLGDLAGPAGTSAAMGLIAAAVTIAIVAPVAASVVRTHRTWPRVAAMSIVSGFALPGIVIALALAVLALNTPVLDLLYQTTPLLVAAYVVHFGSLAFGSVTDAARAVSPATAASARLLEPSRWRRLVAVELPLMRPGLVAGGGLVMLATLKELPATLLLSPIGFRTLATDVWSAFEEGFYADAAVASLALLVVSGVLSWLLVMRKVIEQG